MATLAELQTELAALKAARTQVLSAQSYGHGNRKLDRVNFADLTREIKELERRIAMYDLDGAIAGSSGIFGGHLG